VNFLGAVSTAIKGIISIVLLVVTILGGLLFIDAQTFHAESSEASVTPGTGEYVITIPINISYSGILFEANFITINTSILRGDTNETIDSYSETFSLGKSGTHLYTAELHIPETIMLQFADGTLDLYVKVSVKLWMCLFGYRFFPISSTSTSQMQPA